MRTLDDMFASVIIHNAIKVAKEAINTNESSTEDCIVSWATLLHSDEIHLNKSEAPAPILVVTDLQGSLITDFATEKQAKLVAMKFRVEQIQSEYNIDSTDSGPHPSLMSAILERVWSGEWMGQFNNGKAIYYNELADLLNVPVFAVWDLINDQISQRKADWVPNSYIVVAPSGEEPVRWTSESHGHKEYSCSDFGYWSCAACKQSGDDYTDAADYYCS